MSRVFSQPPQPVHCRTRDLPGRSYQETINSVSSSVKRWKICSKQDGAPLEAVENNAANPKKKTSNPCLPSPLPPRRTCAYRQSSSFHQRQNCFSAVETCWNAIYFFAQTLSCAGQISDLSSTMRRPLPSSISPLQDTAWMPSCNTGGNKKTRPHETLKKNILGFRRSVGRSSYKLVNQNAFED